MLEIKDLKKVYVAKGKNGATTNALDGVTIKFPETGMVFLLGKSGSGKSTLLNVCGGLDTPTSGEIIVKGRSSKDFSKSDFDSYRNTFIGFIFQEYNILNEFSVEDNIALALELQGKKKDKKRIAELLKDVDLEKFAKRKPNTLSGGQKQRIAIARALIKEPEIIMADEPTGALDSNTGKQVLDTLKKLSETKLVIVVSHDREFAEYYGDRIIELKDGKVIEDITKGHTQPKEAGNITVVDDQNLIIKKGTELKASDLETLNKFLKSSENQILISNGQEEIAKYKQIAQISDNGTRDRFDDTDEGKYEVKKYTKEDSKFIKSKLPARHAFKIGTSNLKLKPFRLFFTELLTVGSLVLLGLFSTMMFYDKTSVAVSSLANSDPYIALQKVYKVTEKYEGGREYSNVQTTKFSASDIEALEKDNDEVIPYYNFSQGYFTTHDLRITNSPEGTGKFYYASLSGFAYINESSPMRQYMKVGQYPTASNEIAISQYTYDSLKANKLRDPATNEFISINSEQDILNKKVVISDFINFEMKVTGVYEIPGIIPERYEALKESSDMSNEAYQWENTVANSLCAMSFVGKDFYKDNGKIFEAGKGGYSEPEGSYARSITLLVNDEETGRFDMVDSFGDRTLFNLQGTKGNLTKNDETIYVAADNIEFILSKCLQSDKTISQQYDEALDTVIPGKKYNGREALNKFTRGMKVIEPEIDENGNQQGEYHEIPLSEEERIAYYTDFYNAVKDTGVFELINKVTVSQPEGSNADAEFTLGGFYFGQMHSNNPLVMSEANVELYKDKDSYQGPTYETKYEVDKNAKIDGVFINNPQDTFKLQKLVNQHYSYFDNDSTYRINNATLATLDQANTMIENFGQIFLYVGIGMAVFAGLLLFNFISMSINNKKREIGILRAVGARGVDVFKIFFSESFIITLIGTVIAIIATFFAAGFANASIAKGLGGITLLVFGWKSLLLMVALAVVVMVISTSLPVYFIARKKPVESIRAL